MFKIFESACLFVLACFLGCGHASRVVKKAELEGAKIYFSTSVDPNANLLVSTEDSSAFAVSRRLDSASNPTEVASEIGIGLEKALTAYLEIRPSDALNSSVRYVAETKVTKRAIGIELGDCILSVTASTRLSDRVTGEVFWTQSGDFAICLTRSDPNHPMPHKHLNGATFLGASYFMEKPVARLTRHVTDAARQSGIDLAKKLCASIDDATP